MELRNSNEFKPESRQWLDQRNREIKQEYLAGKEIKLEREYDV